MNKIFFVAFFYSIFGPLQAETQSQPGYLTNSLYLADPAVHLFNGKFYIYPSHDINSGVQTSQNGEHYNRKDYHVLSLDKMDGKVIDYGVTLDCKDFPGQEGNYGLWIVPIK